MGVKKVLKKIATGFLVLLVLLCLYTFIVTDVMKKDYVNVFGYTYFVVASGSMSGTIEVNDIVFVKITDNVKKDDIITFKDSEGYIITHRLMDIKNGKYITKGDANNVSDDAIDKSQVIGKVKMILSPSFLLKSIAIFLIVFIFLALINFDSIIKKFILKEEKPKEKLPDEIFKTNKKKEEISSGLTVTMNFDDIDEMNKEYKRKIKKEDSIEILDIDEEYIEKSKINKDRNDVELETIGLVLSILKCKKNGISKTKMNKKWLTKFQYVYKLIQLVKYRNTEQLNEDINKPPFEEIYDYDLEMVGLTETIRNKIYEMPIYVFLKILTYCILYNDDEMFDGTYKILKYRCMIDKNNNFKEISKIDSYSLAQVENLIKYMREISNKFDNKKVFELDKIERLVKIRNY